MKQITGILKTITAYHKQLADIEKRIDNARNCREYDELVAERQIAYYDMQAAVAALNNILNIKIESNNETMSNAASNLVDLEFIRRINSKNANNQTK